MFDLFDNINDSLNSLTIYKPNMNNPYVENLVEMGYDRADCMMVASAGLDATYPRTIHGRTYETKQDYDEALHEFLNGQ